jgi:aspartate kinase
VTERRTKDETNSSEGPQPRSFDKVLKFGGAALADGPGVERACRIVAEHGGRRPIVVVSAHQGVTSLLDTIARAAAQGLVEGDRVRIRHRTILRQLGFENDILDRYFVELYGLLAQIQRRGRLQPEERDHVLSFGERMSARIVAHALRDRGVPATPVDAWDLGLTTDSNHGSARPVFGRSGTSELPGSPESPSSPSSMGAIRRALAEIPGVPVVTGFLAKDSSGRLTTLGRNGSDLTAALLAEATSAQELQLWKAVGGMMTADPAIVPDARTIARLGFREAAELAFHGAEVLHPDALAPALRADVTVRILDVREPQAAGTLLDPGEAHEGPVGIAARRRIVRVSLDARGAERRVPIVADMIAALARHGLEPAAYSIGGEEVGVLAAPSPALDTFLSEIGRRARVEKDLALVAVVGRRREGASGESPILERALSLLSAAGVDVLESIAGSARPSQVFVLRADDLERGVRALHAGLLAPSLAPAANRGR